MNRYEQIAEYIKKRGGITSMDAFREFNETRLSARIFTMKQKGYPIFAEWKTSKNKDGKTIRYTEYKLMKEQ